MDEHTKRRQAHLRAYQYGISVRTPSDAAQMLVEMGYTYRVKYVEEFREPGRNELIFRIASEVFDAIPDPRDTACVQIQILLDEVREFRVRDSDSVLSA